MSIIHRNIIFYFSVLAISACTEPAVQTPATDGKTLATTYCGSCHVFPEPALLPKSVWVKKVMPNMATRMGIPMGFPYEKLDADNIAAVMNAHVIPDSPMLNKDDMFKIVQYYAEHAPGSPLPQERNPAPKADLRLFVPRKSSPKPISTQNTMLVPLADARKILLGFEDKGAWLYDAARKNSQKISDIVPSDARRWGDQLYLLELQNTQAYNLPTGAVWSFNWQNETVAGIPQKTIDGLIRPVSMDVADINADGKPDFIVCEFGDYLGRLSLFISTPDRYERRELKNYPGACKAYFKDMNNDGLPDIVALMSQAREEICLFLRKKDALEFEEKSVAAFPPCYGTNSMCIADIDTDGDPDILTTHGDNADMSTALKPYHGIRLFLNDGAGGFAQAWFYPMYGASKVIAGDFDGDGHSDIAAIAHFPDFSQKNAENFLFFKGNGDSLAFQPKQFAQPLNGRLLTMDQMDIDADGDVDILIGNFIDMLTEAGTHYQQWTKSPCDWWVLDNKSR